MRAVPDAFRLLRHSLRVVRTAPRLLLVAVVELGVLAVVLGVGGWMLLHKASSDPLFARELTHPGTLAGLGLTWYVVSSYVSGLFTVVVAQSAFQVNEGREVDLKAGARRAWALKWTVLGVIIVDVTVGWVLRWTERKHKSRFARFGRRTAGVAWSAVRALALPVAVREGTGTAQVLKRAGNLVKGRWGTNVVGGLLVPVVAVLMVTAIGVPIVGVLVQVARNEWALVGVALSLVAAYAVLRSVLMGVLSTELYLDATGQKRHGALGDGMGRVLLEERPQTLPEQRRSGTSGPDHRRGLTQGRSRR